MSKIDYKRLHEAIVKQMSEIMANRYEPLFTKYAGEPYVNLRSGASMMILDLTILDRLYFYVIIDFDFYEKNGHLDRLPWLAHNLDIDVNEFVVKRPKTYQEAVERYWATLENDDPIYGDFQKQDDDMCTSKGYFRRIIDGKNYAVAYYLLRLDLNPDFAIEEATN